MKVEQAFITGGLDCGALFCLFDQRRKTTFTLVFLTRRRHSLLDPRQLSLTAVRACSFLLYCGVTAEMLYQVGSVGLFLNEVNSIKYVISTPFSAVESRLRSDNELVGNSDVCSNGGGGGDYFTETDSLYT